MAAFSANMMQVNFETITEMKEEHIVQVFQALKDAGLSLFLGNS